MIYHLHGYWDIPSGKGLKIEHQSQIARLNFQLNNIWMEFDYDITTSTSIMPQQNLTTMVG